MTNQQRRQLFDLAKIIDGLPDERVDDPAERAAILRGLATWPAVLRDIARHATEDAPEQISDLPIDAN